MYAGPGITKKPLSRIKREIEPRSPYGIPNESVLRRRVSFVSETRFWTP